MERFANPCPVCGADDDHAERMRSTREAAARWPVYTICPHPEQPGHGSGCFCAMRPAELPVSLEERVAALEAAVERLSQPETDEAFTGRLRRVWPEILRWQTRLAMANSWRPLGTAARTRTGTPGATR